MHIKIQMKAPRHAEIELYDEIDHFDWFGVSAKTFRQALNELKEVDEITLRINSYGGDVFDGKAIYNALRNHEAAIRVEIDGVAASAASVIALAGETVHVGAGAMIMIHNAWAVAAGDHNELRKHADTLEKIRDESAELYARRSGQSVDEIKRLMDEETWFSGAEAVAFGLADSHDDGDVAADDRANARAERAASAFMNSLTRGEVQRDENVRYLNMPRALMGAAPKRSAPPAPPAPVEAKPSADPQESPGDDSAQGSQSQTKGDQGMDPILELRAQLEKLQLDAEDLEKTRNKQSRNFTADEKRQLKSIHDDIANTREEIELLEANRNNSKALTQVDGRRGGGDDSSSRKTGTRIETLPDSAARGDGGFTRGFGEFMRAVYMFDTKKEEDPRLVRIREASTNFASGNVGSEGGHLIPDDFRNDIYSAAIEQDELLSQCRQLPTSARTVSQPYRDAQAWDAESLQSLWTPEGGTRSQSKPKRGRLEIKVNKLTITSDITEEDLEDAPLLEASLRDEAIEVINWGFSYAVAWGTGEGMPLGFMNSDALVTVAKETAGGAQTADTIVAENFWNMYAAMPPRPRMKAVWLCHPNAEPQLWKAALHAPSGADPLGTPPGSIKDSPYGQILGRPVVPHEICNELGDLGDLMFVALSEYGVPLKSGGIRAASSIHAEFKQDLETFKFTLRAGGQPMWAKPAASRDGSFARSPFVTLAAR